MSVQTINIDPEILGGTPVFYGTRVPIKNFFDYLEAGHSIDYFLEDFEGVQRAQVLRLLEVNTLAQILHAFYLPCISAPVTGE